MIFPGDEDIIRAVVRRCQQDPIFRRQLDHAVDRHRDDDIARLVQQAATRTFGVIIDTSFKVIEAIVRERGEAVDRSDQTGE